MSIDPKKNVPQPAQPEQKVIKTRVNHDENLTDDRKASLVWLNIALWTLAVILTLFSAVYQRITGPTHPISGFADIAGERIKYKLLRTWGGDGDAAIEFKCTDAISGSIHWKPYKTTYDYTITRMEYDGTKLVGKLPHQPVAGKLEYYIVLRGEKEEVKLPSNNMPAIIRFKGDVPPWVLIPHILLMFTAMLFAMRVLIDSIRPMGLLKKYSWLTFISLTIGGMMFGMLVQKYAFGEYWTGIPFGFDLTDNKTLIAWVAWIIAIWFISFAKGTTERRKRLVAFCASLIMTAIFMIPHSMFGSELDYTKLEQGVSAHDAIRHGQ
jgi:hypothetical protein